MLDTRLSHVADHIKGKGNEWVAEEIKCLGAMIRNNSFCFAVLALLAYIGLGTHPDQIFFNFDAPLFGTFGAS